jgi:membrane protein involved in colicin uptake
LCTNDDLRCCLFLAGTWRDQLAEAEAKTARLQAKRDAEAKNAADAVKRLQDEKATLQARVASLEAAERERAAADDAQRSAVARQVQNMER